MKILKKMRGQIWSLDFAISLFVFLLVLIPIFFVWAYINTQSQQQKVLEEMEHLALSISDMLIRTKGIPEDWNETNVKVIGLADEENVLSVTKVSYFVNMGINDYNRTKAILTGGYDFFFNLSDVEGTTYALIGNKSEGRMIVPIERYCIYNEKLAKIQFALVL
jgi:uncharacterized protein (UPF0333 family)